MNTMHKSLLAVAIAFGAAAMLAIAGCQNPLQVGLGNKVDLEVPDIALTSHAAGQYLSGTVTLSGVYTDDFEIQGITLSFDNGVSSMAASTNAADRTWSYEVNTAQYPDGEIEVLLTITDQSGKEIQKRILYYFDNTPPMVLVKNPQGYATNLYNGIITVRGESADRFGLDEVVVRIVDDTGAPLSSFDPADGTNSWTFEFDSRLYADPAGDIGLEVRATDRAGNQSSLVLHYDDVLFNNGGAAITIEDVLRIAGGTPVEGTSLTAAEIQAIYLDSVPISIDNDLDKPSVTIVSPNNGQNIGGSVLVTGTAYDDDGILAVQMRIDLNGDGDYDDQFNIDGTPGFDGMFEVEADWETLPGTVLWTQDLNLDGELYSVEPGHEGRVAIQVRAVDINGLVGNPIEIAVRFDDTIPRIESLNYVSGDYVSGEFTLTGNIEDDERVDRVRISYDGGISYSDIFNRSGGIDTGILESPPYPNTSLSLSMPIDTGNIPGQEAIDSDPLYLRLLVIDNAGYQALTYLTLNVDNLYPTGTYTADPEEIEGVAFIQGEAEDAAGVISGLDRVDVYFVRGGDIYNNQTGAFAAAGSIDFGDGDGAVPYVPVGTLPEDYHLWLISIDNEQEAGDDAGINGDGDGFNEWLSVAGSTYTWWVQLDTEDPGIDDGPIDLHYVVYDSAGNGNHYEVEAFVKNHRPVIDLLTVGTDLDFSGTVEGDERSEYTAPLSVRGRLYVNIDAFDSGGSSGGGINSYEVRRQSDNSLVATDPPGGNYNAGAEIDVSSGYTEGATVGLYALVTDTDGITARRNFSIVIDNDDDEDPEIDFYPITKDSVVADSGHVESAGESRFNNLTGIEGLEVDADVSGTIELTGEIRDNQRVRNVYLAISGYNLGSGAGNEHLIAYWDAFSDELVSNVGVDLALSPEWDVATGHTVGFAFTWDSSGMVGVADTDVVIAFRVEDFGSLTADATASTQIDVVPYITDLEIGLESGTLSYLQRSALGSYPIAYSDSGADTFRINGFNLDPGAGGVTIGSNVLTEAAQDTTNYRWVDVRKNSLNSGALTVTTNGVASINNTNDNAFTQNQEAAAYYPDRTDDRYVAMFGLESHTGWAGKTEAVMKPNAARDNLDWMYVNNGQGVYFNDTQLTYSWSIRGGDMARNDVGTLMWIYLHDMNWFSGQNAWDYYGSVQWGKDEAAEDAAYNWHRATRDRLALGNLSFNTDPNYPYNQVVMNRYRNLQLILDGNNTSTRNFAAYFDTASESRSIVFWSFLTGTGVGGVTALAGGWTSDLQKFTNGNTGQNYPAGDYRVGLRTPFTGISRIEVTAGGADSEHFDMAWDDGNGILYIAYYDEASGRLELAYNLNPAGTPAAWTTRAAPVDTGAGLYVDLAIDPDGGIHLAYFDGSQSNLKYAYLSAYDAAAVETYTVDALFTNGMYNGIVVKDFSGGAGTDYRPVIASFSLSYSGTRYPIRVSWPTAGIGSFGNGAISATGNYTGNWEVIALPAATPPGSFPIHIETDGAAVHQGQVVVGYNGAWIEEAVLYDE